MPQARDELLQRILGEVAANGLADRSLRELAEAVGSSHRMLLYHFESRAGLVAAIVETVEASQRAMLWELAAQSEGSADLVRKLWAQVSSEELRPFVRLFFECVGVTGGVGLTEPWLDVSATVGDQLGIETDVDELRLGVAVTRGLLIDVLATGDAEPATRSLERFIAMWAPGDVG
ncbi:MAG: TetR/AcrR family transcriptional regulator [Dehalococcoidia bacterium]